jgi:putative peptidoglycan lipid II flippase
MPAIAQDAANNDWERFRGHFRQAAMLVAIPLIPAAAFLLAVAKPVVSILFLHGNFNVGGVAPTAATLQMLVPFMLALAGINIVKKAYFALDDRTTLLIVGAIGLVLTAGVGYLLSTRIGVEGLGVALSLSAVVQLLLYLLLLRRKTGVRLGLPALIDPLGRLLLAAAPAGALARLICGAGDWSRGPALLGNWLLLAAAGVAGGGLYLLLAWVLRVEGIRELWRRIQARLG